MSEAQFAAQLAKIDELVAQNQAQSREIDGQRIRLHWIQELLTATQVRETALAAENTDLKATVATLEESLAQARDLLLAWNRTNEAQLAELTRLYGIEQSIPGLQSQVAALEQEVKALRDWNAATLTPARCECKTCDSRASHQHQ